MSEPERIWWNPYVAGVALGLVALTSFVVTGRGLGASGAMKRTAAAAVRTASPTFADENPAISSMIVPGQSLLSDWIVFMAVGVVAGGAIGAVTRRRFRVETVRGPRIGVESRWVLAVVGGVLSGFAAQLAKGCTSGQAVTGGAQLALGSWIFMFSVFGGAYGLAWFVRKQWV